MLAIALLMQSACATVTIQPGGGTQVSDAPTYEDTKSYYLLGVIGEHEVNVGEVCKGRKVVQMQRQNTFLDGFLTVITLGIYAPTTAKVWCEGGAQ